MEGPANAEQVEVTEQQLLYSVSKITSRITKLSITLEELFSELLLFGFALISLYSPENDLRENILSRAKAKNTNGNNKKIQNRAEIN